MEIQIFKDRQYGRIVWEPTTPVKIVKVEHPDPNVVKLVRSHFKKKRSQKVPNSNRMDDYTEHHGLPTENPTFFSFALCELLGATEVEPLWGSLKGGKNADA